MNENLRQIVRYVSRYKGYAASSIVFNLLSAILATLVFILLDPFLKVLFDMTPPPTTPPSFSYSVDYLFDYLNFTLGEAIAQSGKETALIWVCQLIVGLFFFKNIFHYLAVILMGPVRKGIVTDIRCRIFDKLLLLPLSFFSEERKGDLMGRITADVNEVENGILQLIETIIKEPFVIVISLITIFSINTKLAL